MDVDGQMLMLIVEHTSPVRPCDVILNFEMLQLMSVADSIREICHKFPGVKELSDVTIWLVLY